MNTLSLILTIIVALAGYPVGLIIARLTKEELKPGRKWFLVIILACIILVILSLIFIQGDALIFLAAAFVFIILLSLASVIKSRGRR